MRVAFGLLLFFGGPLVLLIGLVKPAVFRGGRLRAVALALAVSAVGLAGSFLMTSSEEWREIRENGERDRAERAARDARESAEREAAREAAAVERDRRMREEEARELRERAEASERRAAEARAAEERAAEERARAEAAAAERARPRTTVVHDPQGRNIFIWRDRTAHEEAMRLINAGVHRTQPQLVMPLIACIVPSDTTVVTLPGGGWTTNQIMVVDGPQSGCRGIVPMEDVQRR